MSETIGNCITFIEVYLQNFAGELKLEILFSHVKTSEIHIIVLCMYQRAIFNCITYFVNAGLLALMQRFILRYH